MDTTQAPDITPGYPSNGAKLGPAWQTVWAELSEATDYLDGRTLADRIAPDYGLEPITIVVFLSRAAKAGILAREGRMVKTAAGNRNRTHYAIAGRKLEGYSHAA